MKIQNLIGKLALQNGYFFTHFVVFTSTLVYSVVYNQSVPNRNIYRITNQQSTTASYDIVCDYTYYKGKRPDKALYVSIYINKISGKGLKKK